MPKRAEADQTFLASLAGAVVTSLPVVSALVFFAVTIKVFRVANMETATTVAVVSQADVIRLLKGVILTLLPGFLAAVVSAAIWWWAADIPRAGRSDNASGSGEEARSRAARHAISLGNPRFVLVIACLAVAFFTLPWSVLLVFLLPWGAAVVLLGLQAGGRALHVRWARPLLRGSALAMSLVMIGTLALSSTVWLPVRKVSMVPGFTVALNNRTVSGDVSAYILDASEERVSLLLDDPRAVVTVLADKLESDAPLCTFAPSPNRWLFLRASQVLGIDPDFGTPYPRCPQSAPPADPADPA